MDSDLKKKNRQIREGGIALGRVLDQTEEIKENIESAADNLSSVDDILQRENNKEKPENSISINDAIAHNIEAESRVVKAADDLAQVNTELELEISDRIIIESELVDMTINLIDARDDLARSQDVGSRTVIESELAEMKIDLAEAKEDLLISRANEEEARQMAFQDALTGLPNRVMFEQALEHGIIQAKRHGWGLAVLFIDIDKFKSINDSHGHDLGDRVLLMVASRLRSTIRAEDTVSRWGGDEFVCLLLEVKLEEEVIRLATEIVYRIAEEWEFKGTVFSIKASIGISIFPMHGETADILFKKADRAMYNAKGVEGGVMMFRESD